MKLAVYQGSGRVGDVAANLAIVDAVAQEAAAAGAGLVVFPEAFVCGYNIGDRVHDLAEAIDGPAVTALCDSARRAGIAVLCGYYERAGDRLHNAAVLAGADGNVLANYRKCQLFGAWEQSVFTPGEGFAALATVGGLKVGVLICYDIEFVETARRLALAGADLIAVPTAQMAPGDNVPQLLVPARAAENQLFVAYVNRAGPEGDLDFIGQSCVADPDGADLARAGRTAEGLIFADLDRAAIDTVRARFSYLDDRRRDLYDGS